MSSTNRIDYSLRQNKAIERAIVFDGVRRIVDQVQPATDLLYVGFGSVWFTDFHLAHRQLGVREMISMESDPVTAKRALFNKPYRTISLMEGDSIDIIPGLLRRKDLEARSWIAWLDFDQALDADRLLQIDDLVRYVPDNSFVISTFSATAGQYGKPVQRPKTLRDLFDLSEIDGLSEEDVVRKAVLHNILPILFQIGWLVYLLMPEGPRLLLALDCAIRTVS